MQSNSKKLLIFCIILVIACGIGAIYISGYLNEDKPEIRPTEIKDKYEYNEFQFVNVTTEYLVQRHFNHFKDKLLFAREEAYNLLGSETKKNYPTFEDFSQYVKNNMENIMLSRAVGYSDVNKDNATIYIIVDQFGNKYTFYSKRVITYTVDISIANENSSNFE